MKLLIALVLVGSAAVAEEKAEVIPPEPPKSETPAEKKAEAPKSGAIKYSVFAFANTGSDVNFTSVKAVGPGVNATGNFNLQVDNSFGIGFEARQSENNSFGWAAGASYDFKRSANSATANFQTAGSATGIYPDPKPSLSIVAPFANAIYRFNEASFVIGLNYSIPSFSQGSMGGTTSLSGGFGAQVGMNFQVSEKVSADILYRNFNIKGTRTADSINFDLGTGSISGIQFQGRYTF